MSDQREILRLLYRCGGELGETGRPRRHDILVVAEYGQALGGQRAGRDVEDRGR